MEQKFRKGDIQCHRKMEVVFHQRTDKSNDEIYYEIKQLLNLSGLKIGDTLTPKALKQFVVDSGEKIDIIIR